MSGSTSISINQFHLNSGGTGKEKGKGSFQFDVAVQFFENFNTDIYFYYKDFYTFQVYLIVHSEGKS